MEYRGVEYVVVRRSSPTGWRWSVKRERNEKAVNSHSRDGAIKLAEKYIDGMIKHRKGAESKA
jgi:hypothetical protein